MGAEGTGEEEEEEADEEDDWPEGGGGGGGVEDLDATGAHISTKHTKVLSSTVLRDHRSEG